MPDYHGQLSERGYCVIPSLIDADLIDRYFALYRSEFLPANLFFPKMNTQTWERVRFSNNGFMIDPLADPHCYDLSEPTMRPFCNGLRDIICSDAVHSALNDITGRKTSGLMMSMFFDMNAGTPAHQDTYYLDSLPNRELTAAWIALEDIDERAGRFYLVPKSQHVVLDLTDDEIKTPDLYEKKVRQYMNDNPVELSAPALRKGDVLFWNSGTIHGSHKTIDPRFSRKSFTSHYLPDSHAFVHSSYGNKVRSYETFDHGKFKCRITRNTPKLQPMVPNDGTTSRSLDTFNRE